MTAVQIYEISAVGLLAMDKGFLHRGKPSSDPFCVFKIGNLEKKTTVKEKELNPKWEDQLRFEIPPGAGPEFRELVVEVWDRDKSSRNDPLGLYTMQLPDTDKVGRASGNLVSLPRQKEPAQGTIHFCYAVTIRAAEPEAQHQAGHIGVHDDSGPPATGKFVIEELSATGLLAADRHLFKAGSSDPYCIISVGGQDMYKTPIIKNTLDPNWTSVIQNDIEIDVFDADSEIKFSVWDHDAASRDDFLGEFTLKLGPTSEGKGVLDGGPGRGKLESSTRANLGLSKKPVTGSILCRYMYKAPLDLGAQLSSFGGQMPTGAFGRLVIRRLSCKGLRAADRRLFGESSSDPYCKITCLLREVEKVQKTSVKSKTVNPVWNETKSFWIYERYFEVVIEVMDQDRSTADDSLGLFRFEVPDVDTDWTDVVDEPLGFNPRVKAEAQGTISFQYNVQYDEAVEWSTSFGPIPKSLLLETSKHVTLRFKPLQTQELTWRLMELNTLAFDIWNQFVAIVMWTNKPKTAAIFLVSLYVCWRSLFFQAFSAGISGLLGWTWYRKWREERSGIKPPPPLPPPPPPDGAGGGLGPFAMFAFLGQITQWCYMGAQTSDMVFDLVMWADPLLTVMAFFGSVGLFVISWIVPLNVLCFFGVIYLFTVQSFHWNYPLFERRFPAYRLAMMAMNFAMEKMGMEAVDAFQAIVRINVVSAKNLRCSELAHIGTFLGKSNYPDPFVTVGVGGRVLRTKAIRDSVNPEFNEELGPFYVSHLNQKIVLQVWDDNTGQNNEFMGEASFRVFKAVRDIDAWLPLYRRPGTDDVNELVTGHVRIKYTVERHHGEAPVGMLRRGSEAQPASGPASRTGTASRSAGRSGQLR